MRLPDGVWIGEDMEVYRAGAFEAEFHRTTAPAAMGVALRQVSYEGSDTLVRRTIGLVQHADGAGSISYACRASATGRDAAVISNDEGLPARLVEERCRLQAGLDDSIIVLSGCSREEYAGGAGAGALSISQSPDAAASCSLTQFEGIDVCEEYPHPLGLATAPVGECLAQWVRGTRVREDHGNGGLVFEMYTGRSSCCFIVNDAYVYCGAGRYEVCDGGMFSARQDFRIFSQGDRLDAYMLPDARVAMQAPSVDRTLFDSQSCFTSPSNGEWSPAVGTYFPVKRTEGDSIVLDGCTAEYVWSKQDAARVQCFA